MAMANDILGVSVSGLRASQTALRTVGHNIANAGTEGYSRQRVETSTNPAILQHGSYIGNGVNVDGVERIANNFVVTQLRTDTTLFNDLDAFHGQISQLDNLLSDEATGLSSSLNAFFSSMQSGADDPTSIPARQLIISEANNLADRFNSIYSRLGVIEEGIESSMGVAVARVNSLAENIAQLNVKISDAMGLGGANFPNDLIDHREQSLKELSEIVPLQVFDQGNGQVNVIIGTGQTLVIGPNPRSLELVASDADATQSDIIFKGDSNNEVITSRITGGELGGLIRARDEMVHSAYNQMGRIAIGLAESFNNTHQKGLDLDNQFGGLFFNDLNESQAAYNRVIGNAKNTLPADRVLGLYVRDASAITTSDYNVKIQSGSLYTITRESDGAEVASGLLPGQYPYSVSFDGLELEFEKGSFQAGDQFTLEPTRTAAQDFEAVITAAENVAFASPLLTDAAIGNIGSGQISPGEVLSLTDNNGQALDLFAQAGEMSPPLKVVFRTPTSYDILDNSDPGNPVDLEPPIRDQRYVPGVNNNLFPELTGGTRVSSNGEMVGLPDGRSAVTQAALLPAGGVPSFVQNDFSGANQFSFDVVVANTLGGSNNGTYTVTVDSAALNDEQDLLIHINTQLAGSDVSAYLDDSGAMAFRLNQAGYGDLSINNYQSAAPALQANTLMGFDVEASTFTTVNGVDGQSGDGLLNNGYPAEAISITRPSSVPGQTQTTNIFTSLHASAREIASQLSNIPGVQANAFNYAELSNFQFTYDEPLQIELNGENLLEYGVNTQTGQPSISSAVPDPNTDLQAFNNYVAERINENPNLQSMGIYAVAGQDRFSGAQELRIYSSEGDDFNIALTAAAGDSMQVGDGDHSPVDLLGAGNSIQSQTYVGGRFDVDLAEGISLGSFPPESMLFGDTRASDFAQSTYLGIQATISGSPKAGDVFTLDFNSDAASDNRNALELIQVESKKLLSGGNASLSQAYGSLVEEVGIETASAKINRDAAEQVLQQTEELRNSISGVNLDEEAADLIRFEQMFSANAQVISVARDVFDRLISSF